MSARILVVDDIAANVRLLEAKLAAEYFEVVTASSGPEALELIERNAPDIVLLDVMMPEMDGFEVCTKIRANPKTRFLPVVMVTALSEPKDRVRGLEAGADDFLTKPVNDLALFARVRSLVRLKMMMDEWRMREQTSGQFDVLSGEADPRPRKTATPRSCWSRVSSRRRSASSASCWATETRSRSRIRSACAWRPPPKRGMT